MEINAKTMFACKYCDKSFTRKFTLENHIASQHEKKGYLCEICKVRICRKRPHSCAVEHGVCECFVCGLRFSSSKAMFRHRNLAHPVDVSTVDTDVIAVIGSLEEPRKPNKQFVQPSIDSLLERTLLQDEEEQQEISFQHHPALQYFHLTENTVICCDDIIYLKCPLCLDAYNSLDAFKEHIESYPFLPVQQKSNFFDAISEVIADMTTVYFDPSSNEYES